MSRMLCERGRGCVCIGFDIFLCFKISTFLSIKTPIINEHKTNINDGAPIKDVEF